MSMGYVLLVGSILLSVILMIVSDKRKEAADKIKMRDRKLKEFVTRLDGATPDDFAKLVKEADVYFRTLSLTEIEYLMREVSKIYEVVADRSKKDFLSKIWQRASFREVEFY